MREAVYYVLGIRKHSPIAVFLYRTLEDAKKREEKERRIGFYDFVEIDVEYIREEGEE